jgi:hypothetical protein
MFSYCEWPAPITNLCGGFQCGSLQERKSLLHQGFKSISTVFSQASSFRDFLAMNLLPTKNIKEKK